MEQIELPWGLLIWLLILIGVYLIARKMYIPYRNAFIVALLLAYTYLLIVMPFANYETKLDIWTVLYLLIAVISPLVLAVYILFVATSTRVNDNSLLKLR